MFKSVNYKLILSLILLASLILGVSIVFFTKDNTVLTEETGSETVEETTSTGGGTASLDPPKLNFYYNPYPIEANLPTKFYVYDDDGYDGNPCYYVDANKSWTKTELQTIVNDDGGILRIADTYDNPDSEEEGLAPVTYTVGNLFDWSSSYGNVITELYFGSNITYIGDYFAGPATSSSSVGLRSVGLEKVYISDSVVEIGQYAFKYAGLKEVYLGTNVTTIDKQAFRYCKNVERFTYNAINCTTTFEEGSNLIFCSFGIDSPDGIDLIIGDSVEIIPDNLFYSCDNHGPKIRKVTIGKNVQSIGKHAFRYLVALEEIVYNAEDCEDSTEGTYPFYDNGSSSAPISVTIGSNVERIPNYLFASSSGNIYIDSVEFKGDKCTEIGDNAFEGCTSLTTISIPTSVTRIGNYTFYGCSGLTTINIPTSVTGIGESAFYGCTSLTTISIPTSVTGIGNYTFHGCSGLTTINIPTSVTGIGDYAFYGCKSLTTINIPDSVKTIGEQAFYNCTKVGELTIGKAVTSIGTNAFYCLGDVADGEVTINYKAVRCQDPTSANYPFKYAGDSVNKISVYIDKLVERIPAYLFGASSSSYDPYIVYVKFEEGSQCNYIGQRAFYYCESLYASSSKGVVFQDIRSGWGYSSSDDPLDGVAEKITEDKLTDPLTAAKWLANGKTSTSYSYASKYWHRNAETSVPNLPGRFYEFVENGYDSDGDGTGDEDCYFIDANTHTLDETDLTTIGEKLIIADTYDDQTNGKAPVRYSIGELLSNNNTIKELYFGNNMTRIGDRFAYNSQALESIHIPYGVSEIGASVFLSCIALTEIEIPDSVKTIEENAFSNCKKVTKLSIGEGVTTINDLAFSCLGSEAEADVTINYNAIKCGDNTSSIVNYHPFYVVGSSSSPVTLNIGAGVERIPAYLFATSQAYLTNLNIAEGVTTIGEYAFSQCNYLATINIPNSVTTIERNAFYYCRNVTSVTIGESVSYIGQYAFFGAGYENENENIEIYYNATNYTNEDMVLGIFQHIGNDTSLANLYVGENVTIIPNFLFDDAIHIRAIQFLGEQCTEIGSSVFSNCTYLSEINIPDSVTTIGMNAFEYCLNVENLTIGTGVASIGEDAFMSLGSALSDKEISIYYNATNCANFSSSGLLFTGIGNSSSLVSLYIGYNVEKIPDYAFSNMSYLRYVEFAEDSNCVYIGKYAFNESGITEVNFNTNNTSGWYVSTSSDPTATRYADIAEDDLLDKETAANYLSNSAKYLTYYWHREES